MKKEYDPSVKEAIERVMSVFSDYCHGWYFRYFACKEMGVCIAR